MTRRQAKPPVAGGQSSPRSESWFALLHSDWHAGYRYGICPPDVELDPLDEEDGDEPFVPQLTTTQGILWEWLLADLAKSREIIDGRAWYHVHVGDICHGTNLGEIVTPRLADQPVIAAMAMKPWHATIPNLQGMRIIKGTAVHSMKHGSLEMITAAAIRAQMRERGEMPRFGVRAFYHDELDIGDVRFDIAHKGPPPGRRVWLDSNELRWYVRDIMLYHLKNGRRPPQAVIRGHYHDRRITHVHEHLDSGLVDTWGIIVPAYSIFVDDWTRGATQSKAHMNSGTILLECRDKEIIKVHDLTHTLDLRHKEVLR